MSGDTPTTEPRAFVVSCCDGERSHVVFATTRAKAQSNGPDCGWCDFIDRRVRRAPEFDGGMPTQREMVSKGWWFGCMGPGCATERIDEDTFQEGGVEDAHGDVFCSAACREKAHAVQKEAQQEACKRLAEYAAGIEGDVP